MPEGPEINALCRALKSLGFNALCFGKHLFYTDWKSGRKYDLSFGLGGKVVLYGDKTIEKVAHPELPSGYCKEIASFEVGKAELNLGVDWLTASKEDFIALVSHWGYRKKQIKALLVDQKEICGIGTVWVEKILQKAKIDPKEKANTLQFLSLQEPLVKAIFETRNEALKKPIPKNVFAFINDWNS